MIFFWFHLYLYYFSPYSLGFCSIVLTNLIFKQKYYNMQLVLILIVYNHIIYLYLHAIFGKNSCYCQNMTREEFMILRKNIYPCRGTALDTFTSLPTIEPVGLVPSHYIFFSTFVHSLTPSFRGPSLSSSFLIRLS